MYQKLTLVGNLGGEPELRYLQDGQQVANFSVACNRRWSDRSTGAQQEEVVWFRVTVWGRQAEAVNQYLRKGRQVLVDGRLKPDPETGGPRLWARQDGSVATSFEVTADRVQFLRGQPEGESYPNGEDGTLEPAYAADDLPF